VDDIRDSGAFVQKKRLFRSGGVSNNVPMARGVVLKRIPFFTCLQTRDAAPGKRSVLN
jgi:hypothetical protein